LALAIMIFIGLQPASFAAGLPIHSPCHAGALKFEGWDAEQLSNQWLRLTIVPQLGGRLMQVEFTGHPYLFVNPRYKGKYIAPAEAAKMGRWINYGGDKLWPLPEGQGEGHWPGPISDELDFKSQRTRRTSAENAESRRDSGTDSPSYRSSDRGYSRFN
jgi:hypothetical protein